MVIRTFHKKRNIKKIIGVLFTIIVGSIAVAKITNFLYSQIIEKNNEKINI
jgi:hypothetical protein